MTNVAIMGMGVVGGGVAEILLKNANTIKNKNGDGIQIKYVLDLRDFPGHPLEKCVVHDINVILNDPEVTIVAELMGGAHPAYEFSLACLKAGKSVVTSNKEVVATFGDQLLQAAEENHVRYLFEASVGGGIPIIRPICQCLAANRIYAIDGILNGTTNYILTQMFKYDKSMEQALQEAQEKGYAERNSTADIDGIDACRKIAILSALAFGVIADTNDIYTHGIRDITLTDVSDATKYGGTIKLIGSTAKTSEGISVFVCPTLVPHDSPLSSVEDVFNGIVVKGDAVGDVMFYGRGAGNLPTASAVVADMIDIMSHTDMHVVRWNKADASTFIPFDSILFPYYVRLNTTATPVQVATALGEIQVITQTPETLSFVTTPTSLCALRAAVGNVGTIASLIRVLQP